MPRSGRFLLGLAALWSFGCAVDDRVLSPQASSSSAGAGGGGAVAGNAGSSSAAGDGGAGASVGDAGDLDADGSDAPMPPLVCSDSSAIPNCLPSLAHNATFDSETSPWLQDPGTMQAWVNQDANARAGSGALSVLNSTMASNSGTVVAGSGQCLAITAGDMFAISADVFIAGSQNSSGAGGIYVSLFATADCTESTLPYFAQSTLPTKTDAWSQAHMNVDTSAPELVAAQSMSVRLVAQKQYTAAPFAVLFDNVLIEKQ